MAYTAIRNMRERNRIRFGGDFGPFDPPLYENPANRNDLKSAALRFLHERCERLLFDPVKTAEEARTGVYLGKSRREHQIPYDMEADLNRLSLEKSLEAFIDSGIAEDAYAVYYCYLAMFFGRYGNSRKMVSVLRSTRRTRSTGRRFRRFTVSIRTMRLLPRIGFSNSGA